MDKIHTALGRFKEFSANRGSFTFQRQQGASVDPQQIIYTQTRSINVPLAVLRERRILASLGGGAFLEAYKVLRTQVMHRLRENGWNVLGVTSPREQEGKTLTSVNLAISLAMDVTQTVLLVDADLRKPAVDGLFGLKDNPGLSHYLLDNVPIKNCLFHPNIGRFVILPGGESVFNSAEMLTSPKMISLLQEMKHRYASRIVIFDLPPLLSSADTLAFSPHMDATLLVVEEGKTTKEEIEESLHLLKGTAPVIGTVLNKAGKLTLSARQMRRLYHSSSPLQDSTLKNSRSSLTVHMKPHLRGKSEKKE